MTTPETETPAEAGTTIPLPQWIAVTKLSLAEIGALVVIVAGQTRACGMEAAWEERMNTKEMLSVLRGLNAKGVATITWKDKRVRRVMADINAVRPKG